MKEYTCSIKYTVYILLLRTSDSWEADKDPVIEPGAFDGLAKMEARAAADAGAASSSGGRPAVGQEMEAHVVEKNGVDFQNIYSPPHSCHYN